MIKNRNEKERRVEKRKKMHTAGSFICELEVRHLSAVSNRVDMLKACYPRLSADCPTTIAVCSNITDNARNSRSFAT